MSLLYPYMQAKCQSQLHFKHLDIAALYCSIFGLFCSFCCRREFGHRRRRLRVEWAKVSICNTCMTPRMCHLASLDVL